MKWKRVYDCLMPKLNQSFCSTVYKVRKKWWQKKRFLIKRGSGGLNQKWKEGFSTALNTAIQKDSTTSIVMQANELKVREKTVKAAIKKDLSPDLNPLITLFEKKSNATSHWNIGSLQMAIEEEWNKMSEEFILKASKSFWWRVDIIIEKNCGHIE